MTTSASQRRYLPGRERIRSWVAVALMVAIGAVIVEVMLEAWVQNALAPKVHHPDGTITALLPSWPKALKSGLYLCLGGLTVALVALDRSWRRFATRVDLAVAVLAAVMVLSGLVGGSGAGLIGAALFVAFRGALLFYALRALQPAWPQLRRYLWLAGGLLALSCVLSYAQIIAPVQMFKLLGFSDLSYAKVNRTQGFFDHPNHLGHVTLLALLGLLAYLVGQAQVRRRWWVLFWLLALALSGTQSRESTLGFLVGAALIAFWRRGRYKAIVSACLIVLAFGAMQLGFSPANRAELARRLGGVWAALLFPSGQDNTTDVPQREIRILYAQEGVRLWVHQPLLGYGAGQFGGVAAYEHDPHWYLNPRFGPGGFDMQGSTQKQVDSFWLHTLVEIGLLGVAAYLYWLFCMWRPLAGTARRWLREANQANAPPGEFLVPWAAAIVPVAALVALLSPLFDDPLFPPLLFAVVGAAWVIRTSRAAQPAAPAETAAVGAQP